MHWPVSVQVLRASRFSPLHHSRLGKWPKSNIAFVGTYKDGSSWRFCSKPILLLNPSDHRAKCSCNSFDAKGESSSLVQKASFPPKITNLLPDVLPGTVPEAFSILLVKLLAPMNALPVPRNIWLSAL